MSPQGNLSSNDSCMIHDGMLSPLLPIGYIGICIVGLICNIITLCIFFLRRHTESSSMTVYMRNLALADTLLVLCLPLRVYYHNAAGPFNVCKAVGILFYLNMYSSILFLSLISLDRYLKIIKPVWVFRIQKKSWSQKASYGVWALLILGMMPFLTGSGQKRHACDNICFHYHSKGIVAGGVNIATVVLFIIFYAIFISFYIKIIHKLKGMSLGNSELTAKKRVMFKTILVPAVFTVCFLPYHAVRIPYVLAQLDVIGDLPSQQMLHMLNESTLLLSALNSCLDPIIYYFLSSAYRKTLLCAIQGKFKNMYALNRRRISINRSLTEI